MSYRRARVFDGYVDAINATDGSGANCHMSSLAVCALLTRVGYAPVMQISCRDKNRIAIQGDILGGAAMGVCNMLCLTGDGVQAGDHPQAKPVFDLDCVSLLEIARTLRDEHHFHSGRKITSRRGCSSAPPRTRSRRRYDWRAAAARQEGGGRRAVHPDPVLLRHAAAQGFMGQVESSASSARCSSWSASGPLRSAKTAEWMRKHVPGVHVPDARHRAA